MAERVVLHVGLMKSGTSFIQQVLRQNSKELEGRGILFPGPWGKAQVQAVKDIVSHGSRGEHPVDPQGPWQRLVARSRDWPGTVVISMEFLAPRKLAIAKRIVSDLEPAEVEVVISVRDLVRTIPAMWQESIQNWGNTPWEEYVQGVREEDRRTPGPGRSFWMRQDASGITSTWQKAAGRDRVTVLTLPQPGAEPGLLWDRFAGIVGTPSAGLDLDVPSNPSLGLPSLLVVQRLNELLQGVKPPLTGKQYEQTVKQFLAKRALSRRDEVRLGFDAEWAMRRGDEEIERLRKLDPVVVGDLAELRGVPVRGVQPTDVPVEDQLEAALDALTHVTAKLADRGGDKKGRKKRKKQRRRL